MNQQDKSFLIVFTTVMSVLVLIAVVIFFVAQLVGMVGMVPADTARQEATIDERIQPVGRVRVAASSPAQPAASAEQAAAAPASTAPAGADVYNSACAACHAAGVLNAPKSGSKEDWESRYAQGLDTLVSHAINGINAMPAKGGNATLSDDQVRDAVIYMLGESGLEVAAAGTAEEAAAGTQESAPAAAVATAPAPAPAVAAPGADITAVDEALAALQEDVKAIDQAISALRAELAKGGAGEEPAQEAAPAAQETPAAEEAAPTSETPAEEQAAAVPVAVDLAKGEEVYKAACFACHMTGAAGAPMLTDKAAWETRAQQGMDMLVNHALNGLNAMPAKGGNPNLSEQDIRNATAYMLNEAGAEASATGAAAAEPALAEAEQQPAEEPVAAVAEQPAQPAPEPQAAAEMTSALPASVDLERGKQLYQTTCVVCHQNGVAGAPKYGDKDAWAPRVEQGFEQLVEHSLNGYKGMPARGGKMDVPDEEIVAAVAYMVEGVK